MALAEVIEFEHAVEAVNAATNDNAHLDRPDIALIRARTGLLTELTRRAAAKLAPAHGEAEDIRAAKLATAEGLIARLSPAITSWRERTEQVANRELYAAMADAHDAMTGDYYVLVSLRSDLRGVRKSGRILEPGDDFGAWWNEMLDG